MSFKYTDRQLLDRTANLPSFKGFPDHPLDIWIRETPQTYDRFTDKVYTYECFGDSKEPEFIGVNTGTTRAGRFGLKKFHAYNPLGCAVLCSDVIVYKSHIAGLHIGGSGIGRPAYIQPKTGGFPYTRDNDYDNIAENYGKIYTNRIGANCHDAGFFSLIINNWSTACLVRNQAAQSSKWLKFMNNGIPVKKLSDFKNPKDLSVAILTQF